MFQPEEEITIERIDFDWVAQCTKVRSLNQALAILKKDGILYIFQYYNGVKEAIILNLKEP